MATLPGKEGLTILRRLIAYSEKVFRFSAELIAGITGRRLEPRIATATVAKSAPVMFRARMGSLNALEMSGQSRFWKRWLGGGLPSADTRGNVYSKMDNQHCSGCLARTIQRETGFSLITGR